MNLEASSRRPFLAGRLLRIISGATLVPFILYFASFGASVAIIMTAPREIIKNYLLIYNVGSIVFSFLFFLYYSYFCSVSRSRAIVIACITGLVIGAFSSWPDFALNFLYPALLIFSDYLATQTGSPRGVSVFRIVLILSVIPFVLDPHDFIVNLAVRCAILVLACCIFAWRAKDEHRISVTSAPMYLAGNYIFYNGGLLAITAFSHDTNQLRIWYTSTQFGYILILKAFDFSMRRSNVLPKNLRMLIYCCAALAPLPALVFKPSILNIILFYVGYMGLIATGTYIRSSDTLGDQ